MIIIGYNQITLHNLKQVYLNLEPPAVLYISISAGHVFMVIWRGCVEGLLKTRINHDSIPSPGEEAKLPEHPSVIVLEQKFHKLIHFLVYNPFFLHGKVTFFPIDLAKKKQDLASGHQTPEQGYSSQRLRLEV